MPTPYFHSYFLIMQLQIQYIYIYIFRNKFDVSFFQLLIVVLKVVLCFHRLQMVVFRNK